VLLLVATVGQVTDLLDRSDVTNLYFFALLGFAAFMFFVAFAVFLAGAIYISPMFCGSPNEKKLVSRPQEVEGGEYSSSVMQVNAYFS
jgi:hypothetical protein